MWVMTSWGILMPGLRPAGTIEPGDPRTLQVRARRRKDLEVLRDRYMKGTLGPITQIEKTDYEFRAYCTPESWGAALAQIGAEIDYVKFKETTEMRFGDKILHDLYVQIWGVIFSKLSTKRHQEAYWGVQDAAWGRQHDRWSQVKNEWQDALDETGDYWNDAGSAVASELDAMGLRIDGDVVVDRRGRIDHTFCAHSNSKNAKRRCRRRTKRA